MVVRCVSSSSEEWNLLFAGMVREYYFSTVLPSPLNLAEIAASCMGKSTAQTRRDGMTATWGQHYLWPRDGASRGITAAANSITSSSRAKPDTSHHSGTPSEQIQELHQLVQRLSQQVSAGQGHERAATKLLAGDDGEST